MSNPSISLLRSLYQKRVKFWFDNYPHGKHESTGIVTEYNVKAKTLIIRDDKSGFKHFIPVDQAELIKEGKCQN